MAPSHESSKVSVLTRTAQARVRLLDGDNGIDAATAARLHGELFGQIGPIAKLGERVLQHYCYSYAIRAGLMKAALVEVDGQPAGLAAYSGDSIRLHRAALRSHLPVLLGVTARAVLANPSMIAKLPGAARLMWERRREVLPPATGKFAEIVAFGVLPQYLTSRFMRRAGLYISDLLLNNVLDDIWALGFKRVRGVVLVSNKPAVSFFSVRASRIDPFPTAALPSIQVWLEMDSGGAERTPHLKHIRRPGRSSPAS